MNLTESAPDEKRGYLKPLFLSPCATSVTHGVVAKLRSQRAQIQFMVNPVIQRKVCRG
ncbi:MAG: hypothetical protein LCH73_11095 [Proteobacteria bacterium]|nr:hypothetical protein [Pseudomonadota bacterium]